jgi:hypothetical protein
VWSQGPAGPKVGRGCPHLLRHMGGGVIPSLKKRERGGGGHPLPARIISQHRNTVTNTTTLHETEGKRPARGKSDLYRRRYRFCRGDGSFHYRKSLRHPDLQYRDCPDGSRLRAYETAGICSPASRIVKSPTGFPLSLFPARSSSGRVFCFPVPGQVIAQARPVPAISRAVHR